MRLGTMLLAVAALAAPVGARSADQATAPKWLQEPSVAQYGYAWPAEAVTLGKGGQAIIECQVTERGSLDACTVVSETPPKLGFGAAALALTPFFRMSPKLVNGQPVRGEPVRFPLVFNHPNGLRGFHTPINVATFLPWAETPTAAQLAEVFPKRARGKVESGHVVLRCKVFADGALSQCGTVIEDPTSYGFSDAAYKVVGRFKARTDPTAPPVNLYVDLPVDFRSPDKPVPTRIANPVWIQTPKASFYQQVFPAKAAQAGLTSGQAVLNCQVTHGGALTDCRIAGEEPAGLDFGGAALRIAALMKMNPWTVEGVPVDDIRIQLPIRLDLPSGAKAATVEGSTSR